MGRLHRSVPSAQHQIRRRVRCSARLGMEARPAQRGTTEDHPILGDILLSIRVTNLKVPASQKREGRKDGATTSGTMEPHEPHPHGTLLVWLGHTTLTTLTDDLGYDIEAVTDEETEVWPTAAPAINHTAVVLLFGMAWRGGALPPPSPATRSRSAAATAATAGAPPTPHQGNCNPTCPNTHACGRWSDPASPQRSTRATGVRSSRPMSTGIRPSEPHRPDDAACRTNRDRTTPRRRTQGRPPGGGWSTVRAAQVPASHRRSGTSPAAPEVRRFDRHVRSCVACLPRVTGSAGGVETAPYHGPNTDSRHLTFKACNKAQLARFTRTKRATTQP